MPSSGPSLVKPRKIQVGTEMMSPSLQTYSPCLPSTPQRTRKSPPKLMKTSAVKCRWRLLVTPLGMPAAPMLKPCGSVRLMNWSAFWDTPGPMKA